MLSRPSTLAPFRVAAVSASSGVRPTSFTNTSSSAKTAGWASTKWPRSVPAASGIPIRWASAVTRTAQANAASDTEPRMVDTVASRIVPRSRMAASTRITLCASGGTVAYGAGGPNGLNG